MEASPGRAAPKGESRQAGGAFGYLRYRPHRALLLLEPAGQQDAPAESSVPAADYRGELEESLCRIVTAITGEAQPTVVVTLSDNGRSLYAADERESGRQEESASSQERETSPILLEDAQGNQHALTVTQTQPEVQGVVVVSDFAGDPAVREKLLTAVCTALDLSSARVCVTSRG